MIIPMLLGSVINEIVPPHGGNNDIDFFSQRLIEATNLGTQLLSMTLLMVGFFIRK